MHLNSLKKVICSVLKSKRMGAKPALPSKSTITAVTKNGMQLSMQPELFMHLPCDSQVFALLDLPTELVEAIISEMVTVVGFNRAVRLRFVNKLFDEAITEIIFSQHHAHLLPLDRHFPMQKAGRIAFAKTLEKKVADERLAHSPLHRTINGCVDLVESLSSHHSSDQRQTYTSILCACTVNVMSMREAIEVLSPEDKTPIEDPSIGALTVASALGDITLMEAIIAHESRVENGTSSFFQSAIDAAAEYGHINAVKTLIKYEPPDPSGIYGAIRGGNKDAVQLFLDKFYNTAPYRLKEVPRECWKEIQQMVLTAAAANQTDLLSMLLDHFPSTDASRMLKSALYHAVLFSATSTIVLLLNAGVDISNYEEYHGTGLYITSKRGNLETVRLLVQHGYTEGDGALSYGKCMHVAVAKGHLSIVQFFLDIGVDINCRFDCPGAASGIDDEFWDKINPSDPATTNAARNGDFRMFCFLVRKGGRVDLDNEFAPIQKCWLEQLRAWEENLLVEK